MSRTDPLAQALVQAIHASELDELGGFLREHPGLASARLTDEKGGSGTALHAASDWPGFFPNGPRIVAVLIDAGGDPNAAVEGSWHAETPLHWAASSDDVEVARALIDGGADIEAPGASIAGGSPLDDAVGYGCWNVAHLLVERGARVEKLWHAAALGMISRAEQLIADARPWADRRLPSTESTLAVRRRHERCPPCDRRRRLRRIPSEAAGRTASVSRSRLASIN